MRPDIKTELEDSHREIKELAGTVLLFPIDGPLPAILQPLAATGDALLVRLQPLASTPEWLSVVLLTGHELSAIAACFRDLVEARKVAFLAGVDGTQYNAVFESAVVKAGLHALEWSRIESAVETKARLDQALADRGSLSTDQAPQPPLPSLANVDDDFVSSSD